MSQIDWAAPKYGFGEDYSGLSTTYTFVQQGYTANISCMASSSPAIILNNTGSVERTLETPSGPVIQNQQRWSWSTNCSADEEYCKYLHDKMARRSHIHVDVGEVDIWVRADGSPIGNGLFATSVCFFRNFLGPSNQSFREFSCG